MNNIKKIFQIAISNKPIRINEWSYKFKMNLESFQSTYPGADYYLYQDSDIKEIIFTHFDSEILKVYEKLKPFAFKADLARYCLLYVYGGLYSDLSYLHINPMSFDDNIKMVLFRDISYIHPSWALSNALIYSVPRRRELERSIEMISSNAKVNFLGSGPLDVTGPYLFGRAIAEVNSYKDIIFGDSKELVNGVYECGNLVKMLPNQGLIAMRNKKYGAQIEDYGIGGTNDYAAMWYSKDVWSLP
jgi:hypothetical protein